MKLILCIASLLGASTALHGQGCAQCQDNLREMPMKTQTAYRHAIELMVTAGVGVFAGGAWAIRRFR